MLGVARNPQRGSLPDFAILEWMQGDRLIFVSEEDNWPHLYSVSASGGRVHLLTPGSYQVDGASITPDPRAVIYSANAGATLGDDDRRHLFLVDAETARVTELTSGASSEWDPVALFGNTYVFNQSTAQQPALVMLNTAGTARALDADLLPRDFPAPQLVTPKEVTWRAPDGWRINGTLFLPAAGGRHPAVIFVHGGPSNQMLLTWHYSPIMLTTTP